MNNYPEPIPGAPAYVVWLVGVLFVLLALLLVGSVVWIALFVYRDAQTRRTCALAWLLATLLGGWLAAFVWFVARDRYPDLILEQITARQASGDESAQPGPHRAL